MGRGRSGQQGGGEMRKEGGEEEERGREVEDENPAYTMI